MWMSLSTTVATPSKWPGRRPPRRGRQRAVDVHGGGEARRVHLRHAGHENQVHAGGGEELQVALLVARIPLVVLALPELRGVHEDGGGHGGALGRAARTSARWPSCRAPMVGTRPSGRGSLPGRCAPRRRCSRQSCAPAPRRRRPPGLGSRPVGAAAPAPFHRPGAARRGRAPAKRVRGSGAEPGRLVASSARWARTVPASPRATGPVSARSGPRRSAFSSDVRTSGASSSRASVTGACAWPGASARPPGLQGHQQVAGDGGRQVVQGLVRISRSGNGLPPISFGQAPRRRPRSCGVPAVTATGTPANGSGWRSCARAGGERSEALQGMQRDDRAPARRQGASTCRPVRPLQWTTTTADASASPGRGGRFGGRPRRWRRRVR